MAIDKNKKFYYTSSWRFNDWSWN